jgi:hypothetical protein
MKNIDFLPAEYRQEHGRRNVRFWRVLVVVACMGMFIAATLIQGLRLFRARADLKELRTQYATAEAQNSQLARLQEQSKKVNSDARLITYLRHPWPKTRILAALLTPLPDSITLSQLEIKVETASQFRQRRFSKRNTEEGEAPKLPAERDLETLREEYDAAKVLAVLSGQTVDPPLLHRYLDELQHSSLFEKVELDELESVGEDTDVLEGAMAFTVVVQLRPGYGQPHGPKGSVRVADRRVSDREAAPNTRTKAASNPAEGRSGNNQTSDDAGRAGSR